MTQFCVCLCFLCHFSLNPVTNMMQLHNRYLSHHDLSHIQHQVSHVNETEGVWRVKKSYGATFTTRVRRRDNLLGSVLGERGVCIAWLLWCWLQSLDQALHTAFHTILHDVCLWLLFLIPRLVYLHSLLHSFRSCLSFPVLYWMQHLSPNLRRQQVLLRRQPLNPRDF